MCNDLAVVPYSRNINNNNNNRWSMDGERERERIIERDKLMCWGCVCVCAKLYECLCVCLYPLCCEIQLSACLSVDTYTPTTSQNFTLITRPSRNKHTHTHTHASINQWREQILFPSVWCTASSSTSLFDSVSTHWSTEGLSVTVPTDLLLDIWPVSDLLALT